MINIKKDIYKKNINNIKKITIYKNIYREIYI